ncbi:MULTISPECIES: DNA methyltransferase [unclassified Rathayibacter]|uniref:class I SAM-dependent DNA methyltransferase n=1 Tax=unclassified Rathayibacter TaxID=2609250 RepID=UPI0011B01F98|nr:MULTISPECIES: DNA methyltransferase [unclassified Rathayibacter]
MRLIERVNSLDFQTLFLEDLNWHAPDRKPVDVQLEDGSSLIAHNVSSFLGLRVWVCEQLPSTTAQAFLDREIGRVSTDRLVIFHNAVDQVWRWPSRRILDNSVASRLTSHRHRIGEVNNRFEARLEVIRLPSSEVLDVNTVLSRLRQAFDVESRNESKQASKFMVDMYTSLERAYPTDYNRRVRDHEISVTLARILFLMFGDDTEMWEPNAFRNYVKHNEASQQGFGASLTHLFAELNSEDPDLSSYGLRYINGGLFQEPIKLPALGSDLREAILRACAVDWSTISPAIFGSMFQAVRDAETRSQLGEHYTSEENILRTLNPLFLDDLRADLSAALSRDTTKTRINSLRRLWTRLGAIRFLDPACGCGNFIIVAYRELRDLELRVLEALSVEEVGENGVALDTDWTSTLLVRLDHFFGIEVDEWPARIAETAMFMVDRQSDLLLKDRFGSAPERLPLKTRAEIVVGRSLDADWGKIVGDGEVIVAGNPPYKGGLKLLPEQQAERTRLYDSLPESTGLRVGRIDYVCAWFAKAADFSRQVSARIAFVATNSIAQGEQARVMGPLMTRLGARIVFARRSFLWSSEAQNPAGVHVVIIGFSAGYSGQAALFVGNEATPTWHPEINWWLTPAPHVEIHPRRSPFISGLPRMTVGSQPTDGGLLLLSEEEVKPFKVDPIASKYLRRYMGAKELLSGKVIWCLYMEGADPTELSRSSLIEERVNAVEKERQKSPTAAFRATPGHLFTHRKHPNVEYIALPQNSTDSRRWIPAEIFGTGVVASNKATIVYPAEVWLLGFLQSQMYQTWIRAVGGRLREDPTITADLAYNSFPWPELPTSMRSLLEAATRQMLAIREPLRSTKSLSELYKPSDTPAELRQAHEDIDRVVDELYGLRSPTTATREAALFVRYSKLSQQAASG